MPLRRRYAILVHLTAPGSTIGGGEALLPGVMAGHNGDAAFGLTLFFGHDEEDVYVYENRPAIRTSIAIRAIMGG